MIDSILYIKSNAPTAARNCIMDLLWSGTTCRRSLQAIAEYERSQHVCKAEDFTSAVWNILQRCKEPAELAKLCRHDMKKCISPRYTNVSDYIKGCWETELSLHQIAKLLREDMEG